MNLNEKYDSRWRNEGYLDAVVNLTIHKSTHWAPTVIYKICHGMICNVLSIELYYTNSLSLNLLPTGSGGKYLPPISLGSSP
jgi:hypothetical protein